MRPLSRLVLDGATTAEGTLDLLSIDELRAAAGVDNDDHDGDLIVLGEAAGQIIANFCKVRAADDSVPTLMAQDLIETFYLDYPVDDLVLAKRPAVLTSCLSDASAVDLGDCRMSGQAGVLRRFDTRWTGDVVSVSYRGGFDEVPAAVKLAAKAMVKTLYAASQAAASTSGAVRSLTLDGVGQVSYDTGSTASSGEDPLPIHIKALLAPYANYIA